MHSCMLQKNSTLQGAMSVDGGPAQLKKCFPMAALLAVIVLRGVVLAGSGTPHTQQQSAVVQSRTNINPGLLYWQAFGALPRLEETQAKQLAEFTDQLAKWSQGSSVGWSIKLPADGEVVFHQGTPMPDSACS